MPFKLPPLPYPSNGLEPFYDKATLEVHHGKHHAAYVEKLNKAIEPYPDLADKSVEELLSEPSALPTQARNAILNNGGGHANHSLFWTLLAIGKGGEPGGRLAEAIRSDFGSFAEFKKKFTASTLEMFGSGWTFLIQDREGKLRIENLSNQESPLSKREKPLLLVDLWEHAYYLKWQNRRPEWVETWWKLVDWSRVDTLFAEEPAWFLEHSA